MAKHPSQAPKQLEVEVKGPETHAQHDARPSHKTTRTQWERHHAQSAPEALARTPGVYVQKTAHAQASPYLRGLTGQRTVILFDKIRLNTSTYRQGPNQYFFTVDHQSIESIEVLRGSASTLYGSNAIGGAIISQPRTPRFLRPTTGYWWNAELVTTTHSADDRIGARARSSIGWGKKISAMAGFGLRNVKQLQTAGPLRSLVDNSLHKSPSFEDDARTQVGTGFEERTADLRLHYNPTAQSTWFAAFYQYRQRDAPRTDKCPPIEGRAGECLTYKKQDRDLGYLGLEHQFKSGFWSNASARLSLSRQYEWRQWTIDNMIPQLPGGTQNDAFDKVWTYGGMFHLSSKHLQLSKEWSIQLKTGADAYYDRVSSRSMQTFTDTQPKIEIHHPRGQYMEGSGYLTAGLFSQAQVVYKNRLWTELGARTAFVMAHVPANPESDTAEVSTQHHPTAGHIGLHWRILPGLRWQNNIDHGFRAPNLDDLSGRQQVGPGFQFENHQLRPERSWSIDSGLRYLGHGLTLSVSAFHTRLIDAIARAPRTIDQCPASQTGPDGCLASRVRFTLVNLPAPATLWGSEAHLEYQVTRNLRLDSALSYAFGQGPSPDPSQDKKIPLSRVPPLHGHLAWNHRLRRLAHGKLRWGGALHWAAAQTRLALADEADARIPLGGTPGFVVVHLNLGWTIWDRSELSLMLENLFDQPYRHHGSSVNGAGRSIRARFRMRFGSGQPNRRHRLRAQSGR